MRDKQNTIVPLENLELQYCCNVWPSHMRHPFAMVWPQCPLFSSLMDRGFSLLTGPSFCRTVQKRRGYKYVLLRPHASVHREQLVCSVWCLFMYRFLCPFARLPNLYFLLQFSVLFAVSSSRHNGTFLIWLHCSSRTRGVAGLCTTMFLSFFCFVFSHQNCDIESME